VSLIGNRLTGLELKAIGGRSENTHNIRSVLAFAGVSFCYTNWVIARPTASPLSVLLTLSSKQN